MRKLWLISVVFLLGWTGLIQAATPPELVNFEGVLRGVSGVPSSGTVDMVFYFYDTDGGSSCPAAGGTLLLTDSHLSGGSGDVTITGGLFNVELGGGVITAGSESSLSEVFRDNTAVYLEVEVNTEPLCPRIHMTSAGYSLNADNLDGVDSSGYINTSAAAQTKAGNLTLGGDLTVNGGEIFLPGGVTFGNLNNSYWLRNDVDTDDMFLYAGNSNDDGGLSVFGDGLFNLTSGNGLFQFKNGAAGNAITAQLDPLGNLQIDGDLTVSGGDILSLADLSLSGDLTVGGGNLFSPNLTLSGDLTVSGSNLRLNGGGASFENFIFLNDTASSTPGILGTGPYISSFSSGMRIVGGGSADDLFLSGGSGVDDGHIHIVGGGPMLLRAGDGNFSFSHGFSPDSLAALSPTGDLQLDGDLLLGGTDAQIEIDATFDDFIIRRDMDNNRTAYFSIFDDGLFEQMRIFSGDDAPTSFVGTVNANSLDYAESFKILDPSLGPGDVVSLIVGRPEYIERAGAAYSPHLLGVISEKPGFLTGNSFDAEEAADPEIATLRNQARREGQLELARQYTDELIKKKEQQLRAVALLGRVPVNVDGQHGPIRSGDHLTSSPTAGHAMAMHEPGPSLGIALEAWDGPGKGKILAFINGGYYGASDGLRAAQQELTAQLNQRTPDPVTGIQAVPGNIQVLLDEDANDHARFSVFRDGQNGLEQELLRLDEEGNLLLKGSVRPSSMDIAEYHPVSEPVGVGDVLVASRENPGTLKLGREAGDPAVVGIVSAEPGVLLGSGITRIAAADPALAADLAQARELGDTKIEQALWSQLEAKFEQTHAPVALTGTVLAKVDAGYGTIEVGDLLMTSPTAGHAMRADDPRPGTVLGKALEPLDAGTGLIKVLVMLR